MLNRLKNNPKCIRHHCIRCGYMFAKGFFASCITVLDVGTCFQQVSPFSLFLFRGEGRGLGSIQVLQHDEVGQGCLMWTYPRD
jgi:hypothetical protein